MGRGLSNNDVTEVYKRYGHLMLRRCRLVLRNETLAHDALRRAFIKLMRYGAEMLRTDARLRWLYRVTDRCCFDVLSHPLPHDRSSTSSAGIGTPHPTIDLQLRDAVMSTLPGLDEQQRTVAVLRFVDGKEPDEIAAEIGLSGQTVRELLQAMEREAPPGDDG